MARVPSADRRMTEAVVEEASVAFETRKNDYYRERYSELRRRNLLPVASAAAAAFRGKSRLTDAEFHDAVQRAAAVEGGPNPTRAADALEHLGSSGKRRRCRCGNPAFPASWTTSGTTARHRTDAGPQKSDGREGGLPVVTGR